MEKKKIHELDSYMSCSCFPFQQQLDGSKRDDSDDDVNCVCVCVYWCDIMNSVCNNGMEGSSVCTYTSEYATVQRIYNTRACVRIENITANAPSRTL